MFRLHINISDKILFNYFVGADLRIRFLCNFKNNSVFRCDLTKNIREEEDFHIVLCKSAGCFSLLMGFLSALVAE